MTKAVWTSPPLRIPARTRKGREQTYYEIPPALILAGAALLGIYSWALSRGIDPFFGVSGFVKSESMAPQLWGMSEADYVQRLKDIDAAKAAAAQADTDARASPDAAGPYVLRGQRKDNRLDYPQNQYQSIAAAEAAADVMKLDIKNPWMHAWYISKTEVDNFTAAGTPFKDWVWNQYY